MNKSIKKEMVLDGRKLSLETGKLAPQANMSVLARYGDTVVLVAVVASAPKMEMDYLPLTCKYEEKLYAGGLIKSSRWVKREGAPTDQAIIAGRLIDHAVRPLFPKDYMDEVNVVATVLSIDRDADPEVLAMIAASAALHASDIPWKGPMVSARVGMDKEGKFLLNPSEALLVDSPLDLVVSLVKGKFLAMEAEAHIVPEAQIVEAVEFANAQTQELATFIDGFAKEVGKDKYLYVSKTIPQELLTEVKNTVVKRVREIMAKGLEKTQMQEEESALLDELFALLEGKYTKSDMVRAFHQVEADEMRHLVLEEGKRSDGRKLDELRKIDIELSFLPRTHGSAIFSRGLTQSLTVVTLGSPSLEQLIQSMYGEESKRYIHHYNFPGFSVGEIEKRRGGPGGREIGHGMLAEKALIPVLPEKTIFPYTIRLVSETLSSSGSSSMAATCGSSLALMDAGVPIESHVAGIAIGIITDEEEKEYALITDMAYLEDANGFMDFKMTGTREGVTAIQVDIKLDGVPLELLPKIVEQSRSARLKILDQMETALPKARETLSSFAPKMSTIKIKPEQIGLVIGTGGKTIRDIEAKTGATLGIDDDGTIAVSAPSDEGIEKAKAMIEGLTKQVLPGEVYEGTVKKILDFGAVVEILPNKEGLVHVSELAHNYVTNVRDILNEGDKVSVKVLDVDPGSGKISLSKKALEENTNPVGTDMQTRNFDRPPRREFGGGGDRRGGSQSGGPRRSFGGPSRGRRPY